MRCYVRNRWAHLGFFGTWSPRLPRETAEFDADDDEDSTEQVGDEFFEAVRARAAENRGQLA
ncbi:hypothetical protein LX83_006971 [Goodfellowiella coeruleoviolacea]|uniref:Uncharacterized protein n=1 Tax=Goodfellowiella coeruleoviolacea TaxID=334858 RepID=A0AAE3GQ25_9PSEU|nr:hypothetical protein [Goodfellowiella coeruleoviolacea]